MAWAAVWARRSWSQCAAAPHAVAMDAAMASQAAAAAAAGAGADEQDDGDAGEGWGEGL